MIFIFIIVLIIVVIVVFNIKIVAQSETFVIERLGPYHTTWEVGINFWFHL